MKDKVDSLEEKAIVIQEPNDLAKPEKDTKFAGEAAKFLVDIIKKNNWSRRLGGQSEHISYEGWQTAGKYYGYTVKTFDSEFVEFGNTWGFKAKAIVVSEFTGVEVGGAEAYCMNDENNWKNKPKFQLASMAQTRAGSKALRQILGFVVALAGYSPTPVEEMTGDEYKETVNINGNPEITRESYDNSPVSFKCSDCHATGKYHSINCSNNKPQGNTPEDEKMCTEHNEVMLRGLSKTKKDRNGEYKTYWWHKSEGKICFGTGYYR